MLLGRGNRDTITQKERQNEEVDNELEHVKYYGGSGTFVFNRTAIDIDKWKMFCLIFRKDNFDLWLN